MRDPVVGRVLALLHGKPEAPWTLERLAEDAALSRSALHDRGRPWWPLTATVFRE